MSISHAVQFYNDDVLLIDAVAAFVTAGSKENAMTIVVATEKHCEELRNALQAANSVGEDKVDYLDAVELVIILHDGWVAESGPIHLDGRGGSLHGPL